MEQLSVVLKFYTAEISAVLNPREFTELIRKLFSQFCIAVTVYLWIEHCSLCYIMRHWFCSVIWFYWNWAAAGAIYLLYLYPRHLRLLTYKLFSWNPKYTFLLFPSRMTKPVYIMGHNADSFKIVSD